MSFFHHGEKPHEEPRVVLNEQPSTETKQTVSAGNDAGNVGDSMTKATYDAVTAGLAQHGTAAESAVNPPVSVDMSVQTLNADGNLAGNGAHTEASDPSKSPSFNEAPQPFDPSPRVDPSDPNAVSEPVGPEKPMIAPHTEVDAFGVPIVKAEPDISPAVDLGSDSVVSEKPVTDKPTSSTDVYYKTELHEESKMPTPLQEDTVVSEYTKPPVSASEISTDSHDSSHENLTLSEEPIKELPPEAIKVIDKLRQKNEKLQEEKRVSESDKAKAETKIDDANAKIAQNNKIIEKINSDPDVAALVAIIKNEGSEDIEEPVSAEGSKDHTEEHPQTSNDPVTHI